MSLLFVSHKPLLLLLTKLLITRLRSTLGDLINNVGGLNVVKDASYRLRWNSIAQASKFNAVVITIPCV